METNQNGTAPKLKFGIFLKTLCENQKGYNAMVGDQNGPAQFEDPNQAEAFFMENIVGKEKYHKAKIKAIKPENLAHFNIERGSKTASVSPLGSLFAEILGQESYKKMMNLAAENKALKAEIAKLKTLVPAN